MEREKAKNSNKKIFWIVFSVILAVVLCYMFVVIYFFYISPYDISAKLVVWPFQSKADIGEMYQDATVKIDFKTCDSSNEWHEKSVVGVNVALDGVIIVPYAEFRDCTEETDFSISTSSGLYGGKLLYGDMTYNLAVLKCENKQGQSGAIKLPYVKIGSTVHEKQDICAVYYDSESASKNVGGAVVSAKTYLYEILISEAEATGIDYIVPDCSSYAINDNSDNVYGLIADGQNASVFDYSGNLIGFSIDYSLENGGCFMMPVDKVNMFLKQALAAYKSNKTYGNQFLDMFKGVDNNEAELHYAISDNNRYNDTSAPYRFYFRGSWKEYTPKLRQFMENIYKGYYLLEDLVINETTVVEKENVITQISVNGKNYRIEDKYSLVQLLYKLSAGQKIKVTYSNFTEEIESEEVVI